MRPITKILFALINACLLSGALGFAAPGGKTAAKSKLKIYFHNYIDNNELKLDSATYKNQFGQAFTVSKFKYYVGNIRLSRKDGYVYTSNEYFLVNEDEPESYQFILPGAPDGDYNSISFNIGVDSAHNCSGAQSGALDPMNGMFWTWNTGYIFLKLEGYSSFSKSPGHIFEYHIGGFKAPNNCIRNVTLKFKNEGLKLAAGGNAVIHIKANAAQVLKSPVAIDFSKLSSVTDSHNSQMVANNYVSMFSILRIEQ
jgi:hypothetical protein